MADDKLPRSLTGGECLSCKQDDVSSTLTEGSIPSAAPGEPPFTPLAHPPELADQPKDKTTEILKVRKPRRLMKKDRAPKISKVQYSLAKELTEGVEILPDDMLELNRVFSRDKDRLAGEYVFKMRLMKFSKAKIAAALSVDERTLDRLFGTLSMSEYLKLRLTESEAVASPQTTTISRELEVAEMDIADFKARNLAMLKAKMDKLLGGITEDKIYDAGVKDIGEAYNKLFSAFRLETGQSTENKQIRTYNAREANLSGDLAELKKLKEAIDEVRSLTNGQKP